MEPIQPKEGMDVKVSGSTNGLSVYYGKISVVKDDVLIIKYGGSEYPEPYGNCKIMQFVDVANEHGDDHHASVLEEVI